MWHRSPASFAFSWVQSRLSTIYQFLSQHIDLRSFWASLDSCHSRVTLTDLFAVLGLRNLVTCHSPHRRPIRPLPPPPQSVGLILSLVRIRSAQPHHQFSLSLRRCSLGIYRLDGLRFLSLFQFFALRSSSRSLCLVTIAIASCPPILSRRDTRNI